MSSFERHDESGGKELRSRESRSRLKVCQLVFLKDLGVECSLRQILVSCKLRLKSRGQWSEKVGSVLIEKFMSMRLTR